MKNYLLSLLAIASVFTACKKEPNGGSTPVKFTATSYVSMGTTDDMGRPNYRNLSSVRLVVELD